MVPHIKVSPPSQSEAPEDGEGNYNNLKNGQSLASEEVAQQNYLLEEEGCLLCRAEDAQGIFRTPSLHEGAQRNADGRDARPLFEDRTSTLDLAIASSTQGVVQIQVDEERTGNERDKLQAEEDPKDLSDPQAEPKEGTELQEDHINNCL